MDGEDENDLNGFSVSISSDGSTVANGAIHNAGNGHDSGHVRVFDLTDALSIKEFNLLGFNIYPNPAQTQITIQLQEGIKLNQATIYNTLGQFISTSKDNIINTSHLSPGMYLIKIETNQGKATKQFIVE